MAQQDVIGAACLLLQAASGRGVAAGLSCDDAINSDAVAGSRFSCSCFVTVMKRLF